MRDKSGYCERCEKPFSRKQRGGLRRFCSTSCQARARIRRAGPVPPKVCLECGVEIPAKNKYCSDAHRLKKHRADPVHRNCEQCGNPFTSATNQSSQRFCCVPCRKRHNKAIENIRHPGRRYDTDWSQSDSRKESYQRRRALKQNATVGERFTVAQVYERDGWTCGICCMPVDSELKYPHPRSASLDHVVPLSKGGEHSYNNTQIAHLSCNIRKGNRVAAVGGEMDRLPTHPMPPL